MPEQQNNVIMGLNENEVAARENAGLVNKAEISTDKSVKEIIRSNTLTYFNLIFFIIAVLLCVVGSFRNLTFLPVVIGNSLIGIFQEIRAKKTLEKMSILNSPHAVAIRSGRQVKISTEELVKDDVVVFSAGDQICADAVVISGNIKVNEALLTGLSMSARRHIFISSPRRQKRWAPVSSPKWLNQSTKSLNGWVLQLSQSD